jgi:hypothetical protein
MYIPVQGWTRVRGEKVLLYLIDMKGAAKRSSASILPMWCTGYVYSSKSFLVRAFCSMRRGWLALFHRGPSPA